ncbi:MULTISPECIES: ABC transporter ATP-binding protein [Paenibacillus]|uniref:ABC transporter ATP-binding protein n=1 Tax=Paenibacillus borealis TaxID=160799 RepID=A0ABX3GT77_PAEBO|nr:MULTISPECIES: ABC transporter ATP-binding protein [Paenibacillus]AIQ16581.1 ABC transporter ATP-binding protein [Paenibacillus sp. FSL H7-0357]OMD36693.1 ABC transporter ATP-binding protein [Paenibacillus borealis]
MLEELAVTGICKSYRIGEVETPALQDITLSFRQREFTAIVGASGSGKSTLLSLLGTLDKPTAGQVKIGDVNVSTLKGNQLADFRFSAIGLVFQHFHLLPTLTSIENVMSPFYGRRTSVNYKARAEALLIQLGLADKARSLPSQLSGGEQQRVAIARALINKPQWLLADEPTGNLDSRNAEAFYELLQQLKTELGCGIIVVTHDLQLAGKADRTIELRDGRVIQERNVTTGGALC